MQYFRVIRGPVSVSAGVVRMNSAQHKRRRHKVALDVGNPNDGYYTPRVPIHFKTGEVFGYDGVDLRKSVAGADTFNEILEVVAESAFVADPVPFMAAAPSAPVEGDEEKEPAGQMISGPRPEEETGRVAMIMAAIDHGISTGQLDPDNTGYFTRGGKPQVTAIESIMGWIPSAAERDAAWKAYQAVMEATEAPAGGG